jgi:hypothetical protein
VATLAGALEASDTFLFLAVFDLLDMTQNDCRCTSSFFPRYD